jgi:hypothetical protein
LCMHLSHWSIKQEIDNHFALGIVRALISRPNSNIDKGAARFLNCH